MCWFLLRFLIVISFSMSELKVNFSSNAAIVLLDFSKSLALEIQDSIQSCYFAKKKNK